MRPEQVRGLGVEGIEELDAEFLERDVDGGVEAGGQQPGTDQAVTEPACCGISASRSPTVDAA
ncbi:hypothetical protein [Nocardia sp. NPDC004860]|uniref:hypothetical protein n=1 Tax=Nocardia sp. NPDC004860 TaxID=3154557 RepID=UPI0033AECB03